MTIWIYPYSPTCTDTYMLIIYRPLPIHTPHIYVPCPILLPMYIHTHLLLPIHTNINPYVHIHIHIHIHTLTNIPIYTCMHIVVCTQMYMHTSTYNPCIPTHIYSCKHMPHTLTEHHINIHVYVHKHSYMLTHIPVHNHTHIHTHIPKCLYRQS